MRDILEGASWDVGKVEADERNALPPGKHSVMAIQESGFELVPLLPCPFHLICLIREKELSGHLFDSDDNLTHFLDFTRGDLDAPCWTE